MQTKSKLDVFISKSIYTAPVDIKKLKFIFSAIENYTISNKKNVEDISVLEVGCGEGGITLPLASLGCKVKAFDIEKKSAEYLQSRINIDEIENITVSVDNGYTFDDGESYDIIIVSEVFEHVLEPLRLLSNITIRMVKGSYLLVTTPNGYGPWELKNRINPILHLKRNNWLRHLIGKQPYTKGGGSDHCQFYTKKILLKIFSKFPLKQLKFARSDSFLTMFSPFRKNALLGNIDIKLADILPDWLASGWYILFEMM